MEIDYDGIEELIEQFIFRDNGALTIPKRIREVAFTLQIDIRIVSVSSSQYLNFKSSPPNGFYGYATIVRRDYSKLIIPIEQPYQSLFYQRQEMAHTSWFNLYQLLLTRAYFDQLFNTSLQQIGTAIGVELNDVSLACPSKPVWEEIPIREVYVRCAKGTQFVLEISYWKAKPININDCDYDGKSGIVDGDKDDGLPSNALPAKVPNSNNPFAGLPSASTPSELGDFLNSKQTDLDTPNDFSDVVEGGLPPATSTTEGLYAAIVLNAYGNDTGKPFGVFNYVGCASNSELIVTPLSGIQTQNSTECDGQFRFRLTQVTVSNSSYSVPFNIPVGREGVNFSIQFGLLPSDQSVIGSCFVNN